MSWDHESIRRERRSRSHAAYAGWSREQLLERILDLETCLYPFALTLGSLADDGMDTSVTSQLFPSWSPDPNKPLRVRVEATTFQPFRLVEAEIPEESQLHATDYVEAESFTLDNGSSLHDDFQVLAVHQQVPGAYVSQGSVSMGDVRKAVKCLWPERSKRAG